MLPSHLTPPLSRSCTCAAGSTARRASTSRNTFPASPPRPRRPPPGTGSGGLRAVTVVCVERPGGEAAALGGGGPGPARRLCGRHVPRRAAASLRLPSRVNRARRLASGKHETSLSCSSSHRRLCHWQAGHNGNLKQTEARMPGVRQPALSLQTSPLKVPVTGGGMESDDKMNLEL